MVVEIESDPRERTPNVRQSVWRVKVTVGGDVPGAFGGWFQIDPTNGTPYALYPVSFGGIPNTCSGRRFILGNVDPVCFSTIIRKSHNEPCPLYFW